MYNGQELGATYKKEYTSFRVWSPTAQRLKVVIYKEYFDCSGIEYEMNHCEDGIWELKLAGDYKNKYYNYKVTMDGKENETIDPYAKGASLNGNRGLIVDFASIDPSGWESHEAPAPLKPTEAIIYEMHIRDFSVDVNSGMVHRGKYLAFTEAGTKTQEGLSTGIDHLKELDITHVHLLPIFDFSSVDERLDKGYNWGYDPYLYFVPEGSYATNPYDGTARIVELKKMIMKLHENNLRVIMDVVFNHTADIENSPFHILAPGYYYRRYPDGTYSNGSGCGNEIATEKSMVRRFIVDCVKFWATEYRIDGFRFDLMALIDTETMAEVQTQLRAINPAILIYGEPWTGGNSALDYHEQFKKGNQRGMGIALFNDSFRNAIKGDNDGTGLGFATGATDLVHEIKKGIVGSISYSDSICGFTETPCETINYVSSHDNLTLYDKIKGSCPNASEHEIERMNRFAMAIIMTSQGIPFIHGGSEILRSKQGNSNSYNAGDEINKVHWSSKAKHIETFNYIQGLIAIRKAFKGFMLDKPEDVRNSLRFIDSPANTVAYLLNSRLKDGAEYLFIIHNSNRHDIEMCLPLPGEWHLLANGCNASPLGLLGSEACQNSQIAVTPLSTYVLIKI